MWEIDYNTESLKSYIYILKYQEDKAATRTSYNSATTCK